MRFTIFTCVAVTLLGAGLVGTISLHQQNVRRRAQVAELRRQRGDQARPDERTRPVPIELAAAREGTNASAAARRAEVAQVRAEIAALEKRAEEQYASHPEATDAPSGNRDPEKGMTRLEYFQNVGQAAPAAAFQTLVWAALKGDEKVMAQAIGLDDVARQKVLEMMAGLAEAERVKYPTPESVFALMLAKALVQVSAIQIVATTQADPRNATIRVRGLMGNDQQLSMRLGVSGWQLWEGEKQAEWLQAELLGVRKN